MKIVFSDGSISDSDIKQDIGENVNIVYSLTEIIKLIEERKVVPEEIIFTSDPSSDKDYPVFIATYNKYVENNLISRKNENEFN